MLNINIEKLKYNNCLELKVQAKNVFHTQILRAWAEINSFNLITLKEIINPNLVENKYIRIGNKTIKDIFLGINNHAKLKEMKIKDLIDNNWKLITTH